MPCLRVARIAHSSVKEPFSPGRAAEGGRPSLAPGDFHSFRQKRDSPSEWVEMPVLLGNDDPAHSVTILDQVRVDQEDKPTNMYMMCRHTK